MYYDFYVASRWAYTAPMSVKVIYKLFTDMGYESNHKIIDPEKYIFFYTLEGTGVILVDGMELSVTPHTLIIVNAKKSLHYHCADVQWNFWLFEFKTPELLFEPNKVYPLILDKTALTLCSAALSELKRGYLTSASAYFQAIYYSAYSSSLEPLDPGKHRLLRFALLYMNENLSNFTVRELCACLNVEERTLRNIFLRHLHTSPKKYFEFLRLEMAKRYLETTSQSISALAATLGFSNAGHLSAAFSKEYGITPRQYRQTFSVSTDNSVSPDEPKEE